MEFRERQRAYEEKMRSIIAEHGIAIQGVFHAEDDPKAGEEPDFSYTVGLAAKGLPELICFGVSFEVGKFVLNTLGLRMLREGFQVHAGDHIVGLIEKFPVRIVPVADSWEHITLANKFYGNPDGCIPALQLVFPDMDGLFPWEPGCDVDWQPVLGPVPEEWREVTLIWPEGAPQGMETDG